MRSTGGLFFILALFLAVPAGAQTRIVTGRVVDSLSSEVINSGQVTVAGTTISANISDDGTFTVAVPPRDVVLTIRSIGFKRQDVNVGAAQSSVDVALGRDYFQLEAIVVTGQATGIERKNLANAVATVNAEELVKSPSGSIEQALQGKLSGAQIMQTSGAPGGGMRVRLRGVTSLLGDAQPLYVVDGVIISDIAISPGINVVTRASGSAANAGRDAGAQESPVNRVADLNPNEIESVEVLKGAAASAIYGSKASNGVIIITSKRGRVGQPQFSITQRVGVPQYSYRYGYRQIPTQADAQAAWGAAGAALWSQNYTPYNHEEYLYNNSPLSYETSLSVNGGTETTRYFASALAKHEGGIVTRTFADKQALRLNLDQTIGSRLTFSANVQVIRNESDRGLTGNDNSGTSYGMTFNKTPNLLDLRQRPDGTWPLNPFASSNFLQTAAIINANETVWRTMTAGRLQFDAINSAEHTLRVVANGGADIFTQKDRVESPPELEFEPLDGLLGTYHLSYGQNLNINLNANAVHTFRPASGAFSASTSFGIQYETRDLNVSRTTAKNLLGGVMAVTAGTQVAVTETHERVEDFGFFAQEEFLTLGDRLLLTVGLRADQSSNNGDPTKLFYYPKAAASYRLTGMPAPIDELKLRAAYGQSGNQPKYGQKFTNLSQAPIEGLPGFQLSGTAGAPDLHPERQREIEGGLDATLLGSRANLEVTVYEKKITDLLTERALAASTGYDEEVFNGGTLRTRGLELGLNLVPVQKATSTWNTRFTFAATRSKVLELEVPPYQLSSLQTGAFIIQTDECLLRDPCTGSPTQLWGNDTLPGAAAGTIVVSPRAIGEMTPKFIMGISNDISYKATRLYMLWDWQNGGMLAAGTWRHQDISRNAPDHDVVNPVTGEKLGAERFAWYRNVTTVYFQPASFLKLREVQLTVEVPTEAVRKIWSGARYVRLGLSGRNLLSFTPYRGGDPEAATFPFNSTLPGARELGAYPPSRSYWFSVDVGF